MVSQLRGRLTVKVNIVIAEHDVDKLALLVLDEEIGQSSAIWNELQFVSFLIRALFTVHCSIAYLGLDSWGRDGVSTVSIRHLGGSQANGCKDRDQGLRQHDEKMPIVLNDR